MLGRDDPSPTIVTNRGGASRFLFIGDHAGRLIPGRLRRLGLEPASLDLHIACDIGVAGLGERLAEALDACFIRQAYSRLVIDCNRQPAAPTSIAQDSDGIDIPGNARLSAAEVRARREEIYRPYQDAISAELDRRPADTVLVSLHSFTPVFQGFARPWRLGVLHRDDSALSDRMLILLRRELGDAAGDNEPYRMDEIDNTVPLHADARGLDYLELEVRQDLIADASGQADLAAFIAPLLIEAQASSSS